MGSLFSLLFFFVLQYDWPRSILFFIEKNEASRDAAQVASKKTQMASLKDVSASVKTV